jgi:hypothetical protein
MEDKAIVAADSLSHAGGTMMGSRAKYGRCGDTKLDFSESLIRSLVRKTSQNA